VSERPRILLLDDRGRPGGDFARLGRPDSEVVRVENLGQAVALMSKGSFDGFYLALQSPTQREQVASLLQAGRILETLADGVAVVTPDLRVTWANAAFAAWCEHPPLGRGFYEALGSPEILGPDYCPFHTALEGKAVTTRLHGQHNGYLELHVTPVFDADNKISQFISLGRDVTAQVQQQQKLDALHQAGNELAELPSDQLAEMGVDERVELLKQNIRRLTHDLLHYDVIEVRLLDRETGRLEPLLQEGMAPAAGLRTLHAKAEGNGITGFVAATGKSYLCPDTATDPLYLEGFSGARSSLTVPLLIQDQVIGTFNVESPRPNAFGEADLKFAEIFSREIAVALHTLELLTAEKRSTATKSVDAISREVALPVDEILAAATTLLDRYIGHEPDLAAKLRQILAGARAIKQSIQKVGEKLAPVKAAPGTEDGDHPRLKGMRVLVADNDERVRRSAHGLLGRFGCVVETARDGQEALTMARLSSYDAILADIRLPDLPGYEAFRRLREAQPKARVILMTAYGYDASHSIVKARQEGLRFVLFKPFRVDQLLDALESPDEPASPPRPGAQPRTVKA
jgi:CheY-like chemotaxis protein